LYMEMKIMHDYCMEKFQKKFMKSGHCARKDNPHTRIITPQIDYYQRKKTQPQKKKKKGG